MSEHQNLTAEIKPAKRILTASEEYGIAVYYVCGVNIAYICNHFDISRSGVNRVVKRLDVGTDRGKKGDGKFCGRQLHLLERHGRPATGSGSYCTMCRKKDYTPDPESPHYKKG